MYEISEMLKPVRDKDKVINDEVGFNDGDWLSSSFMIKSTDLDDPIRLTRFNSIADMKFVDTSMGGNISINCYPQFTRYCDIRTKGVLDGRNDVKINSLKGNIGMGEYYGRVIDDNATNVYFEFGVPKFNNIIMFLLSSVDYKQAVIANSGRSPFFYNAGKVFGVGALFIAFPLITAGILIAKTIIGFATNIFASPGKFEHYYLKPTMFMYWSTVNSIVTMMATELGLLSPVFMNDSPDASKVGAPLKIDQTSLDSLREIMPGLITSGNAINVHAMVARTQIVYSKFLLKRSKALYKLSDQTLDFSDAKYMDIKSTRGLKAENAKVKDLWKELEGPLNADKQYTGEDKPKDLKGLTEKITKKVGDKNVTTVLNDDGTIVRDNRNEDSSSWITSSMDTAKVVFNEGARFAVFRIDHLESITDTFSNSTTSVGLGDKINSMGKTWRDVKFDTGSGTIPGLSDLLHHVVDFSVGAVDGLTFGLSNVVAGFLEGANIDVPKRWDDSKISMPSTSFKMSLISPSAHPIAQLRNIYIPLASIMAGVLPLSTGPRSYTSPYLCSMFIRGYKKIDLGMITSLSITRGTSNLPYNKQRRPLAIDVSFTVTDFSEMMTAPVSTDLLSSGTVNFDDESGLARYVAALCARDLYASTHVWDKAKIKLSRFLQNRSIEFSPESIGAQMGDMMTNNTIFSIFSDKNKVNYSELY